METLLQKDDKKATLSQIAIGNLTAKPDDKKAQFVMPDKTDIKKKNDKIREEVKPMVTSTIVETQSANDQAFSTATDMAMDNAEIKSSIKEADTSKSKNSSQSSAKKAKDLSSGMELLEMDFLLDVVEETNGKEELDVNMRQLCFNEVLRRESRHEVGSAALKVYATNGPTYGKAIQCQAMLELAERTSQNNK